MIRETIESILALAGIIAFVGGVWFWGYALGGG